MEGFLHQIFSGIATGAIYACIGLALVMIYSATHNINFAQGEMAMFSTFIAWSMVQTGLPYWVAFFATLVISFAAGVAIERLIIRPFAKAPILVTVIVFIALLVILNSVAGWVFDHTLKTFPAPLADDSFFSNKYMTPREFGAIGVTLVVLVLLYLFFRFTPLGLAMRAAAQNPESSRLVGIRVSWMLALGWGLAALVGSVAGMLIAPIVYLDPNMMIGILLYGFASALLGGIDNPWGAVVGGFIVGILENLLGAYVIGTELKLSVALVLIVTVLTVRPSGLFGRHIVTRV